MNLLRKNTIGINRKANALDVEIGNQLKQRRVLLGISQSDLAEKVGITFQQIQKYEKGANRISASKLYEFSIVLNVPLSYFFASCESVDNDNREDHGSSNDLIDQDRIHQPETLKLLNIYYSIKDKKLRKNFFKFIQSLAKNYN